MEIITKSYTNKTKTMKALTDKIIEILEQQSNEAFNIFEERAINNAIEMIKRVEKEAEFEEIARIMMKYLCENHDPHVSVIITSTHAELLEGLKSTGEVLDYVLD